MAVDIFSTVPKDYDEAFARLYSITTDEDRKIIRNNEPSHAHSGDLGVAIRYNWNLWGDESHSTALRDDMIARYGLGHADDLSMILLEHLWAKVHGDPFDPAPVVARLKQAWIDNGLDPVTLNSTAPPSYVDPTNAFGKLMKALTSPPGAGWGIVPAVPVPPGGGVGGAGQADDEDDYVPTMPGGGTVIYRGSSPDDAKVYGSIKSRSKALEDEEDDELC